MLEKIRTSINIEDFAKWVASKPKNEKYNYQSINKCPLAQYFYECCHADNVLVFHDLFEYISYETHNQVFGPISSELAQCIANNEDYCDCSGQPGWIFGELSDRLSRLLLCFPVIA